MGLIEAGSEREGLTRVDGGGGWDLWVITQGDTDTEEKQGLPEPTHTHTHTQMFALCCLCDGEADMIAT